MKTETEPKESESDWGELTRECLINILSRLSVRDRWRGTMLVCKSWFSAFKEPSLHSVFDLDSQFDSLPELTRWWTLEFEAKIDCMLLSVVEWAQSSLTQIRIRHCSDRSLALVAQRCPNLEVLSIRSCPRVTDDSISRIALSCPKLRELDISYCYEITHESLVLIGKNCPNLKVLKRNLMNWLDPSQHQGIVPDEYLNACPQDGESEAAAIADSMPGLEWLEIRFSKLSAKGINTICEGCPNLEFLDLSGCANLTSRDIVSASSSLVHLKEIKKPNFYIPRSVFHTERYGHWRLYDERFQTDIFRI
ncbi:F-box protein SKIP1 [Cajanus cajan]|uniref:F-box protein SKIP1 n=1 Tax=Cajanus cajan TaxID=3821 RepID=A0A151S9M1_CAJCA|nr:F-box protein SKIP1 [Cajanus cajan]KYP51463.1 F-box protein SKIP1 [Cajanus cajan]